MEQVLDPANAQYFDKVALYFGAVLGMGGFFWLVYRIGVFMGNRTVAIINAILEVLKKLEVAVEVLQKNYENSEKRLTRLEDTVYTNLGKASKK